MGAAVPTESTAATWTDLGFRADRLARNLEALDEVDARLAALLREAGLHAGLQCHATALGPRVHRLERRTWVPVEEDPGDLTRPPTGIAGDLASSVSLLLGLGTGERAHELALSLGPTESLLVHEDDPSLVLLALSRHDWTRLLREERVRLLLGSELRTQTLPLMRQAWLHPRLGPLRTRDWRHVGELLADQRDTGRVQLTASRKRVVVIRGELLQDELADALEEEGLAVEVLDVNRLSRDQIEQALAAAMPEAVLGINFAPELAAVCGRFAIPYAPWEIDPCVSPVPRITPESPAARWTHVFTWQRGRIAMLRDRGYRSVRHLPLAADTRVRRPTPLATGAAPRLLFVGSCMRRQSIALRTLLEAALIDSPARARWTSFLAAIDGLDREIERDPGRRDVPQRVVEALATRHLPHVIDTADGEADVLMLIGERLASTKRIAVLRAVADLGLDVHGEAEWQDVLPAGCYQGSVGYRSLSGLFANADVNLDLNRVYQQDIVTLRCFEVAACGGFLLTERADDLPLVFEEGREVVTWRTTDELRELIGYYRENPEKRRAIAGRARDRVLSDHTIGSRVRTILAAIGVQPTGVTSFSSSGAISG